MLEPLYCKVALVITFYPFYKIFLPRVEDDTEAHNG